MTTSVIIVKKPKNGAKKAKGHKGIHQADNKATGKYVKQRARTAENKARHILKAKTLKKAADERRSLVAAL